MEISAGGEWEMKVTRCPEMSDFKINFPDTDPADRFRSWGRDWRLSKGKGNSGVYEVPMNNGGCFSKSGMHVGRLLVRQQHCAQHRELTRERFVTREDWCIFEARVDYKRYFVRTMHPSYLIRASIKTDHQIALNHRTPTISISNAKTPINKRNDGLLIWLPTHAIAK